MANHNFGLQQTMAPNKFEKQKTMALSKITDMKNESSLEDVINDEAPNNFIEI